MLHFKSLNESVLAAMGSAMAKSGNARFANVLRYASILAPLSTLYNSRHTKPVAIAVVVAMAGMMRPAINFALSLSTSPMS